MRREQQGGLALIMILLLVTVLSMLILQFSLSARQQIDQSEILVDRAEARMRVKTLESVLLFSLLTETRVAAGAAVDVSSRLAWNFANVPFLLEGDVVRIQDMAGLVPLPAPGVDTREFEQVLGALGVSSDLSREAARRLVIAQTEPSRFALQTMDELRRVTGLPIEVTERLKELMTFYPTTIFNPSTAPERLLAARYGDSVAESLVAHRLAGSLTEVEFSRLTGRDVDLLISFVPGPGFKLTVASRVGEVELEQASVWTVYPASAATPVALWSRERNPSRSPSSETDTDFN